MTSSFGTDPYGVGPYGASLAALTTFNLINAVPLDHETVDLYFDADVDPASPGLFDSASYAIDNGLTVTGAFLLSPQVIRVFVLPAMTPGVVYTVTIVGAIVSMAAQMLSDNEESFVGIGVDPPYVVSNLQARTDCRGRRVYLKWDNPTSPELKRVRIVRRVRSWPFDLTDTHTIVFDQIQATSGFAAEPFGSGTAPFQDVAEFEDTGVTEPVTLLTANAAVGATQVQVHSDAGFAVGQQIRIENLKSENTYEIVTVTGTPGGNIVQFTPALENTYYVGNRVAQSEPLSPNTFYYYMVLTSSETFPALDEWEISDESRVQALSIDSLNSREVFFKRIIPRIDLIKDAQRANGFLDQKWFYVMGCWLNLLRGWNDATALMNDDNEAPFTSLRAKNLGMGIEPEGAAYDFAITRSALLSLAFVYKRRGSCEGIIEAVRMFTKWESECVSFGHAELVGQGGPLQTWDGTSFKVDGQGDSTTITLANRQVENVAAAYTTDEFIGGTVVSSIGDIAQVASNTATVISLTPVDNERVVARVNGVVAIGATVIPLTTTVGLYPGLTIQLEQESDSTKAEIHEITSIAPGVSVTVISPVVHGYAAGDRVSIQKSMIRGEYLGSITATAAAQVITDPTARWVTNQWKGYKLLDANNVLHNVMSNTAGTVTVDGAAPVNGVYAIATDFTVGASFNDRDPVVAYQARSGEHYLLFEPTFDLQAKGTLYDPFNPLWQGPGASLLGAWGPGDVGVYILTPVTLTIGKAAGASLNVLNLDPSQPAPPVNSLVGKYLNPNQNQELLFKIVANTTNTITVASNIESLVVVGQVYYVLSPRDSVRYKRITKRLKKNAEFSHSDVRVHVLFQ